MQPSAYPFNPIMPTAHHQFSQMVYCHEEMLSTHRFQTGPLTPDSADMMSGNMFGSWPTYPTDSRLIQAHSPTQSLLTPAWRMRFANTDEGKF